LIGWSASPWAVQSPRWTAQQTQSEEGVTPFSVTTLSHKSTVDPTADPRPPLSQIDDPAKREELLQAIAHGSAAAWGHLNLLGEYDFSEDKLQDSVGIKPPKLTD
jgi:hypothetical protein